MAQDVGARAIVVMGVSGSGKTTIGVALATHLGFEFIEGDRLHSALDIEVMASGHPLTDAERLPWLALVASAMAVGLATRPGVVAACSALKRSYRDVLREQVPGAFFVELEAAFALTEARVLARRHSFMPVSLLPSQYEALEPLAADESGIRVNAALPAPHIVEAVDHALHARA